VEKLKQKDFALHLNRCLLRQYKCEYCGHKDVLYHYWRPDWRPFPQAKIQQSLWDLSQLPPGVSQQMWSGRYQKERLEWPLWTLSARTSWLPFQRCWLRHETSKKTFGNAHGCRDSATPLASNESSSSTAV